MIKPIKHSKCNTEMIIDHYKPLIMWRADLKAHVMNFFCYKCNEWVEVKLTEIERL